MPIDIKLAQQAAVKAFEAGRAAKAIGSVGGCGRVYVDVCDDGYKSMRKGSKVAKAFEAAGFRVTSRPGYTGVQLYIGYDNASGYEWNRGELVAASLKASGIKAILSGDGD